MAGIDFNNYKGSNLGDPKFDQDAVNLRTLQRSIALVSGNTVSAVVSGITSGNNINISGTTSAITISLVSNVSTTSINAGTILSAGTNLYSIFATTDTNDITRVQQGSNILTGGSGNFPIVSVVPSPSFNNIISSGTSQLNNVKAVTLSANTLSGGTIFSGGTNLYSIFQQIGTGAQTAVQPGSNITTAGTLNVPIVSTVDSPSFNNLTTSGTSLFSGNSANEIVVIRNPDVYPTGLDSFQVWDGSNTKQLFIDVSNQIGFNAGTNGPLYFGTFANPSAGLGGFSSPNQVINNYSVNTIRMGVGGSGSYFAIFDPKALLEVRGKADEIQLIVQKDSTQTENIVEIRDASEVPILVVDANGQLTASTAFIFAISASTLSADTINSGSTNLYSIFQPIGANSTVVNGLNTYTGGTFYNQSVNVSALTIDNLIVSGTSQLNNVTATSLSANTLSGGTIFSGSTDLYSIFQTAGGNTTIGNGTNTYTGGTFYNQTVNVSAATLDTLSVSGSSLLSSTKVQNLGITGTSGNGYLDFASQSSPPSSTNGRVYYNSGTDGFVLYSNDTANTEYHTQFKNSSVGLGVYLANAGGTPVQFGSTTNSAFGLFVNGGNPAIRISTGSNVSIGATTDAQQKLDVTGNVRVIGGVTAQTLSATTISGATGAIQGTLYLNDDINLAGNPDLRIASIYNQRILLHDNNTNADWFLHTQAFGGGEGYGNFGFGTSSNNTNNFVTVTTGGTAIFKSNLVTGFTITNTTGGTPIFRVNSVNKRVGINTVLAREAFEVSGNTLLQALTASTLIVGTGSTTGARVARITQGTATVDIGSISTQDANAGIYLNQTSPSNANYAIFGHSALTQVNSTTNVAFCIGSNTKIALTASLFNFSDAIDIGFNTATGTKIGTSASQKLAFWNTTPIIQPTSGTSINKVLSDTGLMQTGATQAFFDLPINSSSLSATSVSANTYFLFNSASTIPYSIHRTSGTTTSLFKPIVDSANAFYFTNSAETSAAFTIDTSSLGNQKVGINRAFPAFNLDVSGNSLTSVVARLTGDGNRGGSIQLTRAGSYSWDVGCGGSTGTIPASSFGIYDSAANQIRFLITHTNGLVGINTTTPRERFEVNGGSVLSGTTALTLSNGSQTMTGFQTILTGMTKVSGLTVSGPRIDFDGTNTNCYLANTAGNVRLQNGGANTDIIFDSNGLNSATLRVRNTDLQFSNGFNITISTGATGTKIGTANSQLFSFWNATPVIQPTSATTIDKVLSDTGLMGSGATYNSFSLPLSATTITATTISAGTLTASTIGSSGMAVSSGTTRLVEASSGGTLSATKQIVSSFGVPSSAQTQLSLTTNWDINGNYTGTTIDSTYQGQMYYDGNYFFMAVVDNTFVRLIRG